MQASGKNSQRTRKMVCIALLAAIASILMFIEFPLPLLPPFLKLDISAVPVMIGSFMFGPLAGLATVGIKAAIHLLVTYSAGVGELADFLITGSLALTAGLIYKYNKNRKGAGIASIVGIGVTTIAASFANYFILIPFYAKTIMPLEAIIDMCKAINPNITDITGYILFGVVPFNIIKGVVVALLTFLLYKRVSGVMNRFAQTGQKPVK